MLAPRGFDGRYSFLRKRTNYSDGCVYTPPCSTGCACSFRQSRPSVTRISGLSSTGRKPGAHLGQAHDPTLMDVTIVVGSICMWNGRSSCDDALGGDFNARAAYTGGYSHLHQAARLHLLKVLINVDVRPSPISPDSPLSPSPHRASHGWSRKVIATTTSSSGMIASTPWRSPRGRSNPTDRRRDPSEVL